jgi:hypothetical protein
MTPSNLIRLPMLPPRALLSSVLSPVLVAVLAACGGGSGGAGGAGDAAATAAAPPGIAAPSTVQPLSPLLDDEGNLAPSDPAAVPSDPAARTRAGRYATAAQARALEVALDQRVLRTVVEPAANQADAVALAVHLTYALQAAHDLPSSAPVLVQGADARLVAIVADRLADDGFTRVIAVTR